MDKEVIFFDGFGLGADPAHWKKNIGVQASVNNTEFAPGRIIFQPADIVQTWLWPNNSVNLFDFPSSPGGNMYLGLRITGGNGSGVDLGEGGGWGVHREYLQPFIDFKRDDQILFSVELQAGSFNLAFPNMGFSLWTPNASFFPYYDLVLSDPDENWCAGEDTDYRYISSPSLFDRPADGRVGYAIEININYGVNPPRFAMRMNGVDLVYSDINGTPQTEFFLPELSPSFGIFNNIDFYGAFGPYQSSITGMYLVRDTRPPTEIGWLGKNFRFAYPSFVSPTTANLFNEWVKVSTTDATFFDQYVGVKNDDLSYIGAAEIGQKQSFKNISITSEIGQIAGIKLRSAAKAGINPEMSAKYRYIYGPDGTWLPLRPSFGAGIAVDSSEEYVIHSSQFTSYNPITFQPWVPSDFTNDFGVEDVSQ